VRKSIQESIAKIKSRNQPLGIHLENAIKTKGLFFYEPDRDIPWSL
jgi:hypothetical protein